MDIECTQNHGFEDQLSENRVYSIKELGQNSYLIENDKQEQCWYGRQHFTIKLEA
tara:strand:- start:1419 stop:1583 length:165 start_codon:yes stop_codon:yes gene_type:complete